MSETEAAQSSDILKRIMSKNRYIHFSMETPRVPREMLIFLIEHHRVWHFVYRAKTEAEIYTRQRQRASKHGEI